MSFKTQLKSARNLGLAALVSAPLVFGGCAAEMSDSEAQVALGSVIAATAKDSNSALVGSILTNLGIMGHEKEVAREGRTQITINTSPNQPNQNNLIGQNNLPAAITPQNNLNFQYQNAPSINTNEPIVPNNSHFVSSSDYRDLNLDGQFEIGELFNRKNVFAYNDPINLLVFADVRFNNKDLSLRILDEQGNKKDFLVKPNYPNSNVYLIQSNELGSFNSGKYDAKWYLGNSLVGIFNFSVSNR
ncbi:MAG: hypothetical protein Q7S33_01535 [Nanoarchaeota archaeon]|nr:hypothetical protein [Nanoarchaeota archaeon]